MAIPAYVGRGTGYGSATLATSHSVARTAAATIGNLQVAVIHATNTNADAAATVTTAGWTQIAGSPFAGTNNRLILYWKLVAGGVDNAGGTITVVGTGGATAQGLHAQIFEFSSADGWDASPIQAVGTALTGTTTTARIPSPSTTPPIPDCLAVMVMVLNDDAGDPGSSVGEAGGQGGGWAQTAPEFESALGSGGTIALQDADMPVAEAISGGDTAYGVAGDNYINVAFCLVPLAAAATTEVLDTGAIAVAGADLVGGAAEVTLDTNALAAASADLTGAAAGVALETAAIGAAGADLTGAAVSVLTDSGSIVDPTSENIAAVAAVLLDAGALVQPVTADIAATSAASLDQSTTPTVAGVEIQILEARTIELEPGSATVAGSELAANEAATLDAGAIAGAAADLSPDLAIVGDAGAITGAAEDILILAASTLELDGAALELDGTDLEVVAPATVELETGTADVAGYEIAAADVAALLDEGSLSAAATEPALLLQILLASGTAEVAASDLQVIAPTAVELATGAVDAAGSDLATASAAALDQGGLIASGLDASPDAAVELEGGAVEATGSDITPLGEGETLLEQGSIDLAGHDILILAPAVIELDAAAWSLVGEEIIPGDERGLDTGAAAVGGAELAFELLAALDGGAAAAIVGADIYISGFGVEVLDTGTIAAAANDLTLPSTAALEPGEAAIGGTDLGFRLFGLATMRIADAAGGARGETGRGGSRIVRAAGGGRRVA